jgi:hypothetical protein
MANYNYAAWQRLLNASKKLFGKPRRHHSGRVGSTGVEMIEWQIADGSSLIFAHYSGSDINGNPIAQPFSVHYGSDSKAIETSQESSISNSLAGNGTVTSASHEPDNSSTSKINEEWWVQLQDLGNIHCEPIQGVTFEQVVSTAHKTFPSQYIFLFKNKIIAVLPYAGQPVTLDVGSDMRNTVHTKSPVNILLIDGPPYKNTSPFGRMYVYSKSRADCQLSIVYVHSLLGF